MARFYFYCFLPFSNQSINLSHDHECRSPRGATSSPSAFAAASIDRKDPPNAHVFKADLPGINKDEVQEGNILQISGERTRESEEKTDTWHRVERSGGKFLRRFRLPENAKMDQIKAAMENGVLTVTGPKEPEVKSIEISG